MQINLLASSKINNLKNPNLADRKLLVGAIIIWILIISGYIGLFAYNNYTLNKITQLDNEVQGYSAIIKEVNLNDQLVSEIAKKSDLVNKLNNKKNIWSKVIRDITGLIPSNLSILKVEISKGDQINTENPEGFTIKLEGNSSQYILIEKFVQNLQSFSANNNSELQKGKYSDAKILNVEDQDGKKHFTIIISIKKEVVANA